MATHSSIAWKSHGQRRLVGYSPWGHERMEHNLMIKQQRSSINSLWSITLEWALNLAGPIKAQTLLANLPKYVFKIPILLLSRNCPFPPTKSWITPPKIDSWQALQGSKKVPAIYEVYKPQTGVYLGGLRARKKLYLGKPLWFFILKKGATLPWGPLMPQALLRLRVSLPISWLYHSRECVQSRSKHL